jgi:hypothetical protein
VLAAAVTFTRERVMQCHSFVDGRRCNAHARIGSSHCIFHDPEYTETRLENSAAGGIASGETRAGSPPHDPATVWGYAGLDFSSGPGIVAALEFVATMELMGRISSARTRNILRALHIVSQHLNRLQEHPPDQANHELVQAYRAHLDNAGALALHEAKRNDQQHLEAQTMARASAAAIARPQKSKDPDPMAILGRMFRPPRV